MFSALYPHDTRWTYLGLQQSQYRVVDPDPEACADTDDTDVARTVAVARFFIKADMLCEYLKKETSTLAREKRDIKSLI